MGQILKASLVKYLDELIAQPIDRLLEKRYEKHRRIGYFMESETQKLVASASPPSASKAPQARDTSPMDLLAPTGACSEHLPLWLRYYSCDLYFLSRALYVPGLLADTPRRSTCPTRPPPPSPDRPSADSSRAFRAGSDFFAIA
jgi:hypothetical protein